jgi:hypothetical protein
MMRKLISPSSVPDKARVGSTDYLRAVRANEVLISGYNRTSTKPKLKFPGYDTDSIKAVIRSLANGCCGYCGQRVKGIETVIVEHFRPKAELLFQVSPFSPYKVKEKLKSGGRVVSCDFGYFEYGDDLKNMIPACSGCNTGEGNSGIYVTKYIDGARMAGLLEQGVAYGKNNFFPLYGINKRDGVLQDPRIVLMSVGDIEAERPLLFNPLLDEPSDIFAYKMMEVSVSTKYAFIQIRPKPNATKFQRLKAEASISLLGLNRRELCHKRAVKENYLEQLLREIVSSCQGMDYTPSKWGRFSKKYADQFCLENSELIGHGMERFRQLGGKIRSKIIASVDCTEKSIFTLSDNFFVIIKELSEFSDAIQANLTLSSEESRTVEQLMDNLDHLG